MAINKDEIDKYIFDPENPKQCKSYNLLLKIARKSETKSFFSPEFLHYFIEEQVITEEFDDEIWDKPVNYNTLTLSKKLNIYKNNYSERELISLLDGLSLNLNKLLKYKLNFLQNIQTIKFGKKLTFEKIISFDDYLHRLVGLSDNMHWMTKDIEPIYSEHFILFSKKYFTFLNEDDLIFEKSSILVTPEENIDTFLNYETINIKPIFLKKIEDVDILLNVLEQDLKKETQKNIPQENISTLNKINIKDFFSIKEINLNNLKNKKEIYIVGENGDGKSLLLQSIAVGLKGTQEDGLKEFRAIEDKYSIEIENSEDCKNNFLAYGSSRNNSCQLKEDSTGYLTLFSGEYDLKSPTKWLQYLDYSEQKENNNVITVAEAKKLLQELLNSDIEIDINPDKVTFKEKGSEVSFEQLSAGYRGVITIICDMIARLSEKQQVEQIKDFQGIVLIDEVELHLHPKWKYNFMKKLRDTFPLVQFIVTTHSPTVILGASKEAVFYKIYKEDGEVKISNQIPNEGYTHNSLISSPLFDLDSITSRDYDNRRVSSDDYVYDKIHEVVSERIKKEVNTSEEDIMKLINEELDKL